MKTALIVVGVIVAALVLLYLLGPVIFKWLFDGRF